MHSDQIAIERRLLEEVNARRADYHALHVMQDEAFSNAHTAEHGTSEMLAHLKQTNDMGEQVLTALGKYQAATKALTDFYLERSKSPPK